MSVRIHVLEPLDVERRARAAAAWLRAHGLEPGARVLLPAENDPAFLALALGALRSGIVPVVVNPALPHDQRSWVERDADPDLTLRQIPEPDGPEADLAPVPLARPMLYTSGTTGRPKGVWSGVWDDATAAAYAEDEGELWAPEPGGTVLVCSPLYHSAGMRLATTALQAGARVLLLERFDAETVVRLLADEPVSSTFLVPTHLRRIFATAPEPPTPKRAGRILHAGEPCPEALKRRALEWAPRGALWEFYGSTEGQFTAISPEEWLERPGSVGRARPHRRLEIADPDADGVGTVWCRAPAFARFEYWRDPARTAEAWRGDAFTVGDLGRLDDDGYLTLVARREDLIISGGVNVYPAEIERVLLAHPAVHEAAVFGAPDEEWGQRVCAAVVADGVGDDELRAWCAERLAPAQRPKSMTRLDELPKTGTGKVDRARLRA